MSASHRRYSPQVACRGQWLAAPTAMGRALRRASLGVRLSLCALPFGSAETRRGRAARVAVGLSLLGLVTGSTFTLLLGGAQDRARD